MVEEVVCVIFRCIFNLVCAVALLLNGCIFIACQCHSSFRGQLHMHVELMTPFTLAHFTSYTR